MQKFGSLTLYTNDELIDKAKREQRERLKNGLCDGDFRIYFRKKDLSIQIERDGQEWYSIELKNCTTPTELLNCILHIHGKTWGNSSSVIASILTILDDACDDVFGKGTEALLHSEGNLNWKQSKA